MTTGVGAGEREAEVAVDLEAGVEANAAVELENAVVVVPGATAESEGSVCPDWTWRAMGGSFPRQPASNTATRERGTHRIRLATRLTWQSLRTFVGVFGPGELHP